MLLEKMYWNDVPSFLRSTLIDTNLGQEFRLLFYSFHVSPVISTCLKNYIRIIFELFPIVKHAGTDYFPLYLSMPGIFLHPPIIFQGNPCVAHQIPVVSRSYKFNFSLTGAWVSWILARAASGPAFAWPMAALTVAMCPPSLSQRR